MMRYGSLARSEIVDPPRPPRHIRQPGPPRPHYAGKVAIRHAVDAAKAAGIAIGGIELGGDGTIRLYDRATAEAIAAKDLR